MILMSLSNLSLKNLEELFQTDQMICIQCYLVIELNLSYSNLNINRFDIMRYLGQFFQRILNQQST